MEKTIFCTYFDKYYLIKGLALYFSFRRFNPDYSLWILCMDAYTKKVLKKLHLKNVRLITLLDFEDKYLLKAKRSRNKIEYYWTCTSSLPLYVFKKEKNVDLVFYLDADLFFYSSVKPVIDEFAKKSIYVVEHRYPKEMEYRNSVSGRFNVGILGFRRNNEGLECLKRWKKQCLRWCYWREEDGKMGDQLYLNEWPTRYSNIIISKHLGINAAPWNIGWLTIKCQKKSVFIQSYPLIIYHYHQFRIFRFNSFSLSEGYELPKIVITNIYKPYIKQINQNIQILKEIDPNFHYFDKKEKDSLLKKMPNVARILKKIKVVAL
jgi:hypothetical protein